MRLGLLQCGPTAPSLDARHGSYPTLYGNLLAGHGFDWTTWHIYDGDFPLGPDAADGWLISGSRYGAYDDRDWIAPLEALIRDIAAAARPLVGICFGHQVIAQALGGRVEKFDGGWSVGRKGYDWDGIRVHLNAWHQDQVVTPPPGARTYLSNDFTAHAGLLIGATTMTMQPHPEFDHAYIEDMIPVAGPGSVPDDHIAHARAGLGQPLNIDFAAARIAAFLKDHA